MLIRAVTAIRSCRALSQRCSGIDRARLSQRVLCCARSLGQRLPKVLRRAEIVERMVEAMRGLAIVDA